MKRLVIVTKNYGYNFTGATMATQKFVEVWCSFFSEIEVYAINIGDIFEHDRITVKKCKNFLDIIKGIKGRNKTTIKEVYYSDDHFGFILSIFHKKYLHTYHGNWPYAMLMNLEMMIKSFYFIPLYFLTIKGAYKVVNVSKYMCRITKKINSDSIVIYNGVDIKGGMENTHKDCLMVGNIDKRKYEILFDLLNMGLNVNIDIYGKTVDCKLVKKISRFDNLHFMGERTNIPYRNYQMFLSTSKMENLSISVCEAIKEEVPVVCFDVGGLGEVVTEKTGVLIKKFDTVSMMNAINVLHRSPRRADCSVLREFDWEKAAKKYYDEFDRM